MTTRLPYPQVKSFDSPAALRDRLAELGVDLPVADAVDPSGALASPLDVVDGSAGPLQAPHRFCILPREGWDGTEAGRPTDLVRRRWDRFGSSGAGLIWGGEAVAVRADGRANPRQVTIGPESAEDLAELLGVLRRGSAAVGVEPLVGLQLTHSGRWSRPVGPPAPRTARIDPVLDERVGATESSLLSDDELEEIQAAYVEAAVLAHRAGFDFVDLKACHGYLGHELLMAVDRPGRYGGDLTGRSRFLLTLVEQVRARVPALGIGVRLSITDPGPFRTGESGTGERHPDAGPVFDLVEATELVRLLGEAGVRLICTTVGSPYWSPHAQRPAWFPPSDGYVPQRDPMVDAAAMLGATRDLRAAAPSGTAVVGTGFTYFQQFLANVAQAVLDAGWMDFAGLGRMVLSYPELPADVLGGRSLNTRLICRTFSDCTTAPRNGLVSGCYPLDPFYKERPERATLVQVKRSSRG